MTVLLIALGAAVGAPVRHLVDRAVRGRTRFPWGTFAVNVAGCLVLGAVAGWGGAPAGVVALVGTGFCGALTTYSTLAWETLVLGEGGRGRLAVGYVLASTAAGVGAAALGWSLT